MTSSPTANSSTATPGWTTTPETSQPGITGKTVSRMESSLPSRVARSTGFTAAARTFTRTVSGPTFGSGRSPYSRTLSSPNRL